MTIRTAVIDTADWHLAVPLQAAPGQSLDFSGTPLTIALTPILGGTPVATASSDDGTLVFLPANGGVQAYFALDMRVKDRIWRIGRPTNVAGDILRRPDPGNPDRVEWLGRVNLLVCPGSNSTGIALSAQAPVLKDIQPYDGRIVTFPVALPPQGAPLPPLPSDAATKTYTLAAVNGVIGWA